ncbi:MAG: hypothetical protein AAF307_00095 [Pseudomonadota bacterium]
MLHIVGVSFRQHVVEATRWRAIAEHTDLVVTFGGLALRKAQICDGGKARHRFADNPEVCARSGVSFVNLSRQP